MASYTADPFFSNIADLHKTLTFLRNVKPPKVYADPDYLVDYKGCKVNYPFNLNLDQLDSFQARPTDVCVAAFPKTGTTWLSAIVHMILHDGDPASLLHGPPLKFKVPYIEMTIPYGDELQQEMKALDYLAAQPLTAVRAYVTHLNAHATPKRVLEDAKVVYIYRNPKDTIVSLYFFMKASIWFGFNGTLQQVVDDVLRDHAMNAPFFEHLESFWKLRHQPNVFITSYEQLSKQPKATIQRISKFLGKDLSEEQVESVVEQSEFGAMKRNPLANLAELENIGIINGRIARFMRTGQVGNWKQHFTPEMNRQVDEWISRNLQERPALAGLTFEYEQDYDLD